MLEEKIWANRVKIEEIEQKITMFVKNQRLIHKSYHQELSILKKRDSNLEKKALQVISVLQDLIEVLRVRIFIL